MALYGVFNVIDGREVEMKKYILLLTAVLSSATVALAANREAEFSFSPVVGGGYTFDSRQHIDTAPVFGVRAGYNFTDHVGVEALFDYANSSTDIGSKNVNMFRYGGEVLYHFFPEKQFVPYLAAGFSGVDFNSTVPQSESRGIFDYGIGAKYYLSDAFALRADLRHLITTASSPKHNVEYTIGAYIPFGGVAKAANPVVVAPVAVTPPPPPPSAAVAAKPAPVAAPAAVAEPVKQPAPYVATVQRLCNKPAILNINFDFDKSDIKPQYYSELKIDGDFLKEFPGSTGAISGHTDSTGLPDYNQKLSELRANSVKKYLVEKFGVDAARLSTKGYGETKPIDSNDTAAGRARNRRIEAVFDCK
jgi:OOP family OmpA-OmpF porin